MSGQLSLFGEATQSRIGPAPVMLQHAELARSLSPKLYLGTSSWYFPGWAGIVWDRRAPQTVVVREGLAAYAQHPLLRSVGIDRTFYTTLSAKEYRTYAEQVPEYFRFLIKAPSLCTSLTLPRGSSRATPRFLDAAYAAEKFVQPVVTGMGVKAGVLLWQFSPLGKRYTQSPDRFAEELERFLLQLKQLCPTDAVMAVEVRDEALLTKDFFAALRVSQTRYCMGLHARMPSIEQQIELLEQPGSLVVRWNLQPGLAYEQAKARYAPFDKLVDEDPRTRHILAQLCARVLAEGQDVFVIANNKAEGSAPLTLFKLAEAINALR